MHARCRLALLLFLAHGVHQVLAHRIAADTEFLPPVGQQFIDFAGVGAQGTSNKLASDEKFALAAVEYLCEWNPPNDGVNKRAKDVAAEKKAASSRAPILG